MLPFISVLSITSRLTVSTVDILVLFGLSHARWQERVYYCMFNVHISMIYDDNVQILTSSF